MGKREIAGTEEVLAMLTEKARDGNVGAMVALERALRFQQRDREAELDAELERMLDNGPG